MKINQKHKRYISYFLLLFSIVFIFIITSSVLQPGLNRAGDDIIHIAYEYELEKILTNEHTIFSWSEIYGLGTPLFIFRPPLSYFVPVLLHLLTFKIFSLIFLHKLTLVLSMVLYPVAIFYFMRKFKFDYLTSGLAALFTIAPISTQGHTIHAYFNFGLLKQSIAILLSPFALGKLHSAIEDKKTIIWPSVLIALVYLAHPYIAYALILVIGIYFLIKLLCQPIKKIYPRLTKIIIILIASGLLTSLYVIPFISSTELEKPGVFSPTDRDVFEVRMFTTSDGIYNLFSGAMFDRGEQRGEASSYKWNNTNSSRLPFFTLFILIGLIISIIRIKQLKYAFLSLGFLFSFLFMLSFDDIPLFRLIPLYKNYTFLHGISTLEFFAIALAAVGLFFLINSITKLISKYFKLKTIIYFIIFFLITSIVFSTILIDRYNVAKIQIDREALNLDDQGRIIFPSENYGLNNELKEVVEVLRDQKDPGRSYANPVNSFEFFYTTIYPILVDRSDIINGAYVTLYGGINRFMLHDYRFILCCNYNLQKLNNVHYIFSFKNDKFNRTEIEQNSELLKENNNFYLYKVNGNFNYFEFVNQKPILVLANKVEWYNLLVKWTALYRDSKNPDNFFYLIKSDNIKDFDPETFPSILLLTYDNRDIDKLKGYINKGGKIYSHKEIPELETEIIINVENLTSISIEGNSEIQELEARYNINSATIKTDKSKFLYLKKTYYRGWQAKIDGKKTKTYYISPGFNTILVPEGEHKIEFKFKGPNNYQLGLLLTLATLLALIIYYFKYEKKH